MPTIGVIGAGLMGTAITRRLIGAHFDVRSVPDACDLAYTALFLDPHTDNPYRSPVPGVQLLHCLVNETTGGLSTLVDGFAAAEAPTQVVGVRVTPAEVANPAVVRDLVGETVALLRSVDAAFPEIAPGDLHFALREDWFEPGYGVVTPETAQAVRVSAGTGITLETTYTGKAFAAMSADAATGALADARVLYWDTYSSAPMPAPGPDDALPAVLREYIAECDALFGHSGEPGTAGTSDPVRGEME